MRIETEILDRIKMLENKIKISGAPVVDVGNRITTHEDAAIRAELRGLLWTVNLLKTSDLPYYNKKATGAHSLPITYHKPNGTTDVLYTVSREPTEPAIAEFALHIPLGGVLLRKTDGINWTEAYTRHDHEPTYVLVRLYEKDAPSEDFRCRVYTSEDGAHIEYAFRINPDGVLIPIEHDGH